MGRHRTNRHQEMGIRAESVAGPPRTLQSGRAAAKAPLYVITLLLYLVLPAIAASYQERLILSMEAGRCSLRVEADDRSRTLRLRAHPEGPSCAVAKEAMLQTLAAAFGKTDPPKLEGPYSSLYIGRLIDFPWLSQHLAVAAYKDRGWNRATGKPAAVDVNKYVAAILARREVTALIEGTFGDSGYRIVGVSVEKVLVGGFGHVPLYQGEMHSGKIPFDAMVWFRLEKRVD